MIIESVRNLVAFLASLPFRLIPRRKRFSFALKFGRRLVTVLGAWFIRRYDNVCGGAHDETLRIVFRALARMRVPYDAAVSIDVSDELMPALRRGGVVLVSAHFPLNALFTRWLYDHGHAITGVRITPGAAYVWGTSTPIDLLPPSTQVMLQLRRKLTSGRPVLLAIDRAQPQTRRLALETRFGPTHIATPVFTLAERLGVPVFFFGVRAQWQGLPLLTVRRIPPHPEAFMEHFRRHAMDMLP